MTKTFTTVPIFNNFGDTVPIGELRILTSALPVHTGYHFALSYMTDMPNPTGGMDSPYELISVAIVPSHKFRP